MRYSDGNEKKKTKLITCREESCCLASRHERQVNEYEYAITVSNMYGRKIDLIMKCVLYDDRNQKRDLELSSVEIKPIDVSEDVEAIQWECTKGEGTLFEGDDYHSKDKKYQLE